MTVSLSLVLACFWAIAATAIAMLPSRDQHWRAAYGLIAVGIPILGFVTYENGPTAGVICLAAGASVLRWPMIYAFRWLRGTLSGPRPGPLDAVDAEADPAETRPGE